MDTKTLFDNFETIANAPGGVIRLRELILGLAIQGKLIECDPSVWNDSSLGSVVEIIRGVTFPASAKHRTPMKGMIPCLRTTNVQNEVDWDDLLYISEEYVKKKSQLVRENDILISMANSRELVGKVALVKRSDMNCTLGGFIAALRCNDSIVPEFLMALLRVPSAREKLIDSSTQTTNIANISIGRLKPFEIRLPPVSEQKLIVTKVNELMALCDQLEAAQQQRDSLRTSARKSAIDSISMASTTEELGTAWKRISNNWTTIADTPESISSLRSLILNLAIDGRLSNSNTEKWTPSTFSTIGKWIGGNGFPTQEQGKKDEEILFCKVSDMNLVGNEKFIFQTVNTLSREDAKRLKVSIHESGSVIFPKIGGAIATNKRRVLVRPTAIDNNCMGVEPESFVETEWLYLLLSSIDLTRYQSGTSLPSLSQKVLNQIRFSLPPLEEQRLIVAKVDELMEFCDQLESALLERDDLKRCIAGSLANEAAA